MSEAMRSHEASGKGDRKFIGVHPFGGTSIVAYGVGLRNQGEGMTKQGVRPFDWISRRTSKWRSIVWNALQFKCMTCRWVGLQV